MTPTPASPKRRPLLKGLILGVALVALVPLIDLLFSPSPDNTGNRSSPSGPFEQLEVSPARLTNQQSTSQLEVVRGGLLSGQRAAAGLEAILRLHVYLALRDVYPSRIQLDWTPATAPAARRPLIADRCKPKLSTGQLLDSGAHPDPLERRTDPGRDQRLFFLISTPSGGRSVEAILCNRRGAQRAQVFSLTPGKEGNLIREVATWAAAITGVTNPGPMADGWARDPVPSRPGLSRYGDVLVGSTGSSDKAELLLDEASAVVPEAAWLLGQLGNPLDSLAHLRRARLNRPGFTAAIEDRAALLLREDQRQAALRELSLLPLSDTTGALLRPVRTLLASQLVADGQPLGALAVLNTLTQEEREHPGAARLSALANLALARDEDAADQVEIWLAAQPNSGAALVAAGRLRAAAGRWPQAQSAWQQAVISHPGFRPQALLGWAGAAFDRQDLETLETTLTAVESGDSDTPLGPFGLELRAYLAARGARWSEALHIYDRLVESGAGSKAILQNRCHVALTSGQTDQAEGRCAGLTPAPLEGALASSAFDSRRPGDLPGYPRDTTAAALHALRTGPADPAVSITALHSLGPNASAEVREDLLARWRVAVGAGHAVPAGVFTPRGPNR